MRIIRQCPRSVKHIMTMVSAVHYTLQQSYNCYGYGLPKMDIT